jgi:hypothetical protein
MKGIARWPRCTRDPDVPSIAEIAAARPEPPKRNPPEVEIPGVTGSFQRNLLCVDSRPRNVRESMYCES